MKVGDIVVRKLYNKDIVFKIVFFGVDENNEKIVILKGIVFRVIVDVYIDDLELVKVFDIKDILIDKNVENLLYKLVRKVKER